ncbi:hypothetical protein C7S13_5118 [Burkholderia cepacia]|nr:hypothetical protein [Burkholderia cepacia]
MSFIRIPSYRHFSRRMTSMRRADGPARMSTGSRPSISDVLRTSHYIFNTFRRTALEAGRNIATAASETRFTA